MNFAENYARLFVVITVLELEVVNTCLAKAKVVGVILPKLLSFGLFLGGIGYFLFTGTLIGKGKKNG